MNATTSSQPPSKITIPHLQEKKKKRETICCLTAYDTLFANILDQSGIDLILTGDSLGMTRLGYSSTLPVTVMEMLIHLKAVRRGVERALLVADMPYGSYHAGIKSAIENALVFIKDGGAEAVKIEGGRKRARLVERLVEAEIPVMGHLGLTPQSVHVMGGYKVQGRTPDAAAELLEDALILQQAGAFSLVLEGIPGELARQISAELMIPTIGIGAGAGCDGQILVIDDLLGLTSGPRPRFVRQYLDLKTQINNAIASYIRDCRSGDFPCEAETYHNFSTSNAHFRRS
jgi:3-methyl-2-oxobutanoate hydroxymethyltransferase